MWRIETWYEYPDPYADGHAVGYRVVQGEGPALTVAPNGCFRVDATVETSSVSQFFYAREMRDVLNARDITLASIKADVVSDGGLSLYRYDDEADEAFRKRIEAAIRK